MTLAHVEETLRQSVRLEAVCERLGVTPRTIQRWRKPLTAQDGRCGPRTWPANHLSEGEKRRMLAVANSEEFRGISPKQLVPRLADKGGYLASEASFYRVLHERGGRWPTEAP